MTPLELALNSVENRDQEISRLNGQIIQLRALNTDLLEVAKVYDHAHETGNSVPPLMVKRFRTTIAKAEDA